MAAETASRAGGVPWPGKMLRPSVLPATVTGYVEAACPNGSETDRARARRAAPGADARRRATVDSGRRARPSTSSVGRPRRPRGVCHAEITPEQEAP